jgi:hypothetical protein
MHPYNTAPQPPQPPARSAALLNTDARRSRRRSAAPRPSPGPLPDLVFVYTAGWRSGRPPYSFTPVWHLQLAADHKVDCDVERDCAVQVRDHELLDPRKVVAAAVRQGQTKWARLFGHLDDQEWSAFLGGSEGYRRLLDEVRTGVWPAAPSELKSKWRPRSSRRPVAQLHLQR